MNTKQADVRNPSLLLYVVLMCMQVNLLDHIIRIIKRELYSSQLNDTGM